MHTKQEILRTLRSKTFALHVIRIVEQTAACHFISAAQMDNSIKTIRDWAESVEEQKRQQTSAVSVRFAYDFEFAISRACKDFGIDVLRKEEGHAPGHDFRIRTVDAGIIPFEIKTTQSKQGWTGSTHSEGKGKAESYVLISYELDVDLPISSDRVSFYGVIQSAHFAVLDSCEVAWTGEATDNNSSTQGKIHINAFDEYQGSISLGSVEPARKWCKILREELNIYRDSNDEIGGQLVIKAA